ncbi:hypothetical protein [Pelagibius sp.]|nr:hypothetical protein [Pelagibius sp.]
MPLADTKLARWALGFAEFLPLMAFAYAGRFDAQMLLNARLRGPTESA